ELAGGELLQDSLIGRDGGPVLLVGGAGRGLPLEPRQDIRDVQVRGVRLVEVDGRHADPRGPGRGDARGAEPDVELPPALADGEDRRPVSIPGRDAHGASSSGMQPAAFSAIAAMMSSEWASSHSVQAFATARSIMSGTEMSCSFK